MVRWKWAWLGAVAMTSIALAATPAIAGKLRVGKPQAEVFSFVPLDIGMKEGFFQKHGVEVSEFVLGGAAKQQQALAADAIDIGLGSGPALSFVARGAPVQGVAAMAGKPSIMVLAVAKDGPVKKIADLKGKTLSISSPGSVTEWLVRELSRKQGWGPDGMKLVGLGSNSAQIAALRTGQTVGLPDDIVLATQLQQEGILKILVHFDDIAPHFIMHVIFASDKILKDDPEDVRGFLAGWFETIAFMRKNKAICVPIASEVTHVPPEVVGQAYDRIMPMFSDTGRFDPRAVKVLAQSFVDLKLFPKEPEMSKFYTEKYLPAAAP